MCFLLLATCFLPCAAGQIDDPVNVFAVHGGVGIWGVLFPAIMGAPNYVDQVYGGYGLAPVKEGKRYVRAP